MLLHYISYLVPFITDLVSLLCMSDIGYQWKCSPFKNPTSAPVKPSTRTELSAEHQLVESLEDDKCPYDR